jgi:hypothetical protein
MLSRLVECSLTRERLDEVLPLVEAHLETEEDINVALAHRLIAFGDYSGARAAGERAAKIAPRSAHAHFAAGSSAHNEATATDGGQRKAALVAALEHYTLAEAIATELKYHGLIPEILLNRGAVNAMLHDKAAAKADYKASVLRADVPSLYAPNALSFFMHVGDSEGAGGLLQYLDVTSEEGKFFSALVGFDLAKDDEKRRECIRELATLADESERKEVECRLHCVDLSLRIRDWDLARSIISNDFEAAHPFQANTGLAWIAAASNEGDPGEFAKRAVAAGVEDSTAQDRRVLADILMRIGNDATALTLLEQNITPGVFDDDTRKVIECAQQLDRHDLLLRLCRELREAGEE